MIKFSKINKKGYKNMYYYERIKEIREDRDIKQKEIAEYLRITQQQYSLYETGKRPITAEQLTEICIYLGISSDYILGLPRGLKWYR